MLFIIGTRTFHWGSDRTPDAQTCGNCGYSGQFVWKKAIRTLALFFLIPVLPLGEIRHLRQCPNCDTRYAP
ncbi:MAG: hypothetical protein M3440_00695 [Chloroflexota bacterium]|nr:hypothetical protein [Chloroflexota bacterium]